eukprot:6180312-Pleurochrysis_carterae.AAC.3
MARPTLSSDGSTLEAHSQCAELHTHTNKESYSLCMRRRQSRRSDVSRRSARGPRARCRSRQLCNTGVVAESSALSPAPRVSQLRRTRVQIAKDTGKAETAPPLLTCSVLRISRWNSESTVKVCDRISLFSSETRRDDATAASCARTLD